MNLRNAAIWGMIILGLLAVYAVISQNGGGTLPGSNAAAANRP